MDLQFFLLVVKILGMENQRISWFRKHTLVQMLYG